jgi:hypothetical protein
MYLTVVAVTAAASIAAEPAGLPATGWDFITGRTVNMARSAPAALAAAVVTTTAPAAEAAAAVGTVAVVAARVPIVPAVRAVAAAAVVGPHMSSRAGRCW